MTAVYHGRGEKMEGYELYRLSDEEIQHVGVKGMKWGKRKSRSAYMQKVDAHESKTSARRDAKKAASKAKYEQEKAEFDRGKAKVKEVGKAYMKKVETHQTNSQARKDKVAAHKAREKEHAKEAWTSLANRSKEVEAASQAKRDAKKAASKAKYEQEKSEFKQVKDKIAVKKLNKARAKDAIENYKKSLVKSLDDPMVKALVASSIYANNSYSMDSTRTGANAHRQMFY